MIVTLQAANFQLLTHLVCRTNAKQKNLLKKKEREKEEEAHIFKLSL